MTDDEFDPPERTSTMTLVAQTDAPSWARRHTRSVLRAWKHAPDVVESAELAVSELVTNAVQHARPPQPAGTTAPPEWTIDLTIRQACGLLRIDVTDEDGRPPTFAPPSDDAEGGRGLLIVGALAKQWGCVYPPTGGKAVWCELELP